MTIRGWSSGQPKTLDLKIMNVDEFNSQCLQMLKLARNWPDSTWEQLEDSDTMAILDAMCDLEYTKEQESSAESESPDSVA